MPRTRRSQRKAKRLFGVEFEFNKNPEIIDKHCQQAIEKHSKFGYYPSWDIWAQNQSRKYKNSWWLKEEHCGCEFTTPPLPIAQESFEEIRKVLNSIKRSYNQNLISKYCGMHVHVDISDFSKVQKQNLVCLLYELEPEIFSLCHPSRKNNNYVPPLRKFLKPTSVIEWEDSWNEYYQGLCEDRFGTHLNSRTKTVEFRYFAGSIDSKEIINWIKLLCYLVEFVRKTDGLFQPHTCRHCASTHYGPKIKDLADFLKKNSVHKECRFINGFRKELIPWIPRQKRKMQRVK